MMKMNTMNTNNAPPKWYHTLANLFIAIVKTIFSYGPALLYGNPISPYDHVVTHKIDDRTDLPEVDEEAPETEAKG